MIDPPRQLHSEMQESSTKHDRTHSPTVELSREWKVLGPFQIGTREATWGADPLEYYGGFRSLEYDPDARFQSSLASNGTVSWTDVSAESATNQSANKTIVFNFPDVDWRYQQTVFGWAALQYQAWARGAIEVYGETRQTVALYTDSVLEFWVDDQAFFGGDFYSFRRAPLILHLDPGTHQLDIRLIRDVRAMGGNYDKNGPSIEINLEIKPSAKPLNTVTEMLLPDYIEDRLAGVLGSISLQNTDTRMVAVTRISSANSFYSISMANKSPIVLVPGQVRPIAFDIGVLDTFGPRVELLVSYVTYSSQGAEVMSSSIAVSKEVKRRSQHEPHKITFLHPGGIVSYAMLRPPSKKAQKLFPETANVKWPVLLQLHGAGLEADDEMVAHALDPVPDLCAWALFPTGVTPWSGDDWHVWGFADVEAAISAIPSWIGHFNWNGPDVDVEKWFVSGHSNGGQGSWYAATHRPDNVVALAPVSGYLSIQSYVSYQNWNSMDPRRQAIMQASLNNYRHELLAENLKGIPIFQQHGDADDNVPVWHSRSMHQFIKQTGWRSAYNELPGEGHWFDGIMTTKPLRDFYGANLPVPGGHNLGEFSQRSHYEDFSLVVANPAETGSKNGIKVLLLESPDQYGRIDVRFNGSSCILTTSNILSFQLRNFQFEDALTVDGSSQHKGAKKTTTFLRTLNGGWMHDSSEKGPKLRFGRQLGPMDAILRGRGAFQIRDLFGTAPVEALQISRNLHQYFGADAVILSDLDEEVTTSGNSIDVCLLSRAELDIVSANSSHRCRQLFDGFLHVSQSREESHLTVSLSFPDERQKCYETPADSWGFGGAFLRPLGNERLSLVVWGTSNEALHFVSRYVPMLTGVGQPDFILCNRRCTWKGADGVLAMGFFDHEWNITRASFAS